MLFVDDDQAKPRKGKEQGRTRADDNPRLAFRDLAPGTLFAARRDIGVPFRWRHAKPVAEALLPGRRQGDFGKQDQHLLAIRQNPLDRVEIYLGLSRPRHPVQKCRRKTRAKPRGNIGGGGALVVRQRRARLGLRLRWRRLVADQDHLERPGGCHRRDNAGTDPCLALKLGRRQGARQLQNITDPAPCLGQPFTFRKPCRPAVELSLRGRTQRPRLAEGHFDHGADRRHGPGGDTFQKIDKGRRQWRQRGDAGHRLQRFRRHISAARPKHNPGALARAKGDAHDLAARQIGHALKTVIERAVKRHGDSNPHSGRPTALFAFTCHVRNGSALLRQVDSPPVLRYTPRVGTAEFNLHRRADFST